MRGIFFITAAVFIDALQVLTSLAFFGLGIAWTASTPVGGGAAGALAGASLCWDASGGIIQGAVDAVKCAAAGGVIGAVGSPFGIVIASGLSMVLNFTISLTMGTALVATLAFYGIFSPFRTAAAYFGEVAPFLSFLPVWTGFVAYSLFAHKAKQVVTKAPQKVAVRTTDDIRTSATNSTTPAYAKA